MPLSLLMWFSCASFSEKALIFASTQVHFVAFSLKVSIFFVFLSLLCHGVLCFLKKLRFLPQHRYIHHFLCALIFTMIFMENIKTTNEHRFILLLSLSKLKFFYVPQPSPPLLSLGFLAFWVQICVFFFTSFFICMHFFISVFFVFHSTTLLS